ncbi:MAG TPA: type II toxin-antitoxin system HicB family antitoxin [Longimicrobium sp.]|nr:type II toxin-antitoxin system HicB family antitoxin [Longimicrobium sp.]
MRYKSYTGSVAYDPDDRLFYGRVDGITDIVSFQGDTVEALEADFRAAVDDYLIVCNERGVEPQRPCSGRFVLRIPPELHRDAAIAARSCRESLNTWITGAIRARLASRESRPQPRTGSRSAA